MTECGRPPWPETARINGPETARINEPGTARTNEPGTARTNEPGTARINEPGTARTNEPAGNPAARAARKVKIDNSHGLNVYFQEPGRIGGHGCKISGFPHAPRKAMPAREPSFRDTFGAFPGAVSDRGLAESH